MTTVDSYRLSAQQRRLWADAPKERVTARVRLAGPLDPERLCAAVAALVARHETLRLDIGDLTGTGLPVQVVRDDATADVRPADGAPEGEAPDGEAPLRVVHGPTELVLDASALIADPESLRVLLTELAACYGGAAPVEDEDRTQFLDVVEWQSEQDRADLPADPAALTALTLPAQAPGAAGSEPVGEYRAECPAPEGDTEAHALAAWATALGRYADAATVALALHDDGRSVDGTQGVVGPLAAPVRCEVPRALTAEAAAALLAGTRARSLRVTPLDHPVAASFAHVTAADPGPLAALGATGATLDAPRPEAPLHLTCTRDGATLRLALHADPAVADPAAAALLLGAVTAQLTGGRPEDAEAALLAGWEGTAVPLGERTLLGLLDAGVTGADPARTAVAAPDATLTFGELDAAAASVTAHLREHGVGPGDRVVVLGERSAVTVAAFLGVLRAGAVYVPLDPAHPAPWLRRLATTVDAALAVAPKGSAALRGLVGTLPTLELDALPATGTAAEPHPAGPGDPAYVIFTSGSTGTPRPVVVEHGGAAHLFDALEATVYADAPEDLTVAVNASFGFDASVKQLVQLAAGRSLCLVSEETRRDVPALLRELADRGADVLDCTPSHLRLVLDHRESGQRLPGLLLIGGEPLDAELWQRVAALEGVRAVNVYGPTECTVDVTAAPVTPDGGPSIGRPLPGFRVRVLDAEGRPVPPGMPGELFVTGPQVARGYWGDPEATAARFTTVDGVRGYRTGDRVRFLPDGRLAHLGRADGQLKINGYRAEPAEIAAVLAQHPAVGQAVADWRVDEAAGTGTLVGYAVPRRTAGRPLNVEDIAGINPHETRYLFDEIFVQQTYLRGGITLREDAVVVDVGANIGMFSLFVDRACPGARILAFEPLPEAHARLTENLRHRTGPTEVFGFGLSDREQSAAFTVYPGYSMMSGQAEYADPEAEIALVQTFLENRRDDELLGEVSEILADRFTPHEEQARLRRLSDVLTETGVDRIDLLKIDVQRAEWDVLRGLDDAHLAGVQQIAMEVHDDTGAAPHGRLAEIAGHLRGHGFEVFWEQDELLTSTDRFTLCAVRPEYRDDPRPAAEPPVAVPDAALLRQWLAQRLPEPLVPATVVLLDALPLTVNGKIDRAALPAPERPRTTAQPATATERALIAIWEEVLGRENIGVDDNFFAIGGDSIRAIRMRAAAVKAGLSFPLRDVFRNQTVRALAAGIEGTQAAEPAAGAPFALLDPADRALVPAGVSDAYPLTALQLGMVYLGELSEGETHAYHVVTVDTVEGPWAPEALAAAAGDLTAAHDILRTSFDLAAFSRPMQLVHERATVPVRTEDLTPLPEEERARRLREVVDAEKATPFDWRAPMLRLHALRTGEDTYELVQTHFHGVLDGLSLHLMTSELLARLDHHHTGTPAPQAAPVLSYRHHVEAELAAREDTGTRAFWRDTLDGVHPLRLAGEHVPAIGVSRVLEPAGATADALDEAARRAGVPVKSLLLTAHVRALAAAFGTDGSGEVVTGLVVSARPAEEGGDRTLGLFLNTLPVRTDPGAPELAARLWEYEQSLMGHHLLPLADIQQLAAAGPLFDSFFNFTRFTGIAPATDGSRVVSEHDDTVDVGFALASNADLGPAGARLVVQYDDAALPAERIDAYADRLCAEVEALAAHRDSTEDAR
ncbi:amino acid adenylation domain-containing protein [Streptomyces sp. NPDC017615]|uniref:amino acid adenylation domain-containing protein n=2 Tax=unclassified Streptomyces TaxID=2593676 RepID=UPI0037B6A457